MRHTTRSSIPCAVRLAGVILLGLAMAWLLHSALDHAPVVSASLSFPSSGHPQTTQPASWPTRNSLDLSRVTPRATRFTPHVSRTSFLLISALHPGLPGFGGQDEAFQLVNLVDTPLVLTDAWQVVDGAGHTIAFPTSGFTVEARSRIWCAHNALSFTVAFGFTPTLEYGINSTFDVPDLSLDPGFRLGDSGGSLSLRRVVLLDTVNGDEGAWPAGDNGNKTSMERCDVTVPGDDGNWASSVITTVGVDANGDPVTGTPHYTNSAYVDAPAATDAYAVVINEVAWMGTVASHYDEWIELYNNTDLEIDLHGWLLVAADGIPAISLEGTIPARGFYLLERTDDTTVGNVEADQVYAGVLENGGETLYLYRADVVDALAYGNVETLPPGWSGPALQFYGGGGLAASGQILFRKHDEATAMPLPDTDSAADWANDTARGALLYGPVGEGDLYGKRVMYPGWDWGPIFGPLYTRTLSVVATGQVTLAIAPDNAYNVLSDLLGSARREILVGAYTLESVWLTGVLTERIAAGVQVTVLLEGAPAGGLSEAELWNCAQIVDAGGQVFFMHNDPAAQVYSRYRYYHAKVLVVDERWVAIGSENLGNHALPVDDKSNGTAGDRGVFLISDRPEVVEYVASLFRQDCAPTHHRDVVAYGQIPRYVVPPTYTAVYSPGGGGYGYMAPYSTTVPGFEADHLEVLHAPETSLRYSDGLLGLVLRVGAGDEVLVEQMHEPLHWGPAAGGVFTYPNPRLEAYIQVARNGARVRVLLDKGLDDERENVESALYLLDVAGEEGLDLEVRLGNPTGRGIHNKMVLVRLGESRYVHVGSINGTETSSKVNRELALQVRSPGAYGYLKDVFEYDWAHSGGPYETWLPNLYREYVPVSDHVLISEVLFKLDGGAEFGEWVELYNPTLQAVDISEWRLGDAVHRDDYERLHAFPAGVVLSPGETLVVARRARDYQVLGYAGLPVPDFEWRDSNDVPDLRRTAYGEGDFKLGNAGDEVLLLDASLQVVDVVVYGNGIYPGVASFGEVSGVYNGSSLERWPANRDSDDCRRDFRVRYTPDPGQATGWPGSGDTDE